MNTIREKDSDTLNYAIFLDEPRLGAVIIVSLVLGALILAGALPHLLWVHLVGLVCLWAAAALTLITGYDYLRVGLRHMD